MSFKVKFWNFSKRVNSTAVPTATATEYMCVVKTETSLINPTLELNYGLANAPQFNYCQIPDFGSRYYWVREWHFSERLWSCELEIDPLGSFKSDIGSSSFYVLRAASTYDPAIVDTHYPVLSTVYQDTILPTDVTNWWSFANDITSGYYVVGLRGYVQSGQTAGTTTFVIFTPAEFKAFTRKVFDSQMTDFVSGTPLEITDTLAKMIFDPTKFVASCIWVPGSPTGYNQTTGINVGWWTFAGTYKVASPGTKISFQAKNYTLSNHPQSSTRGKYLNTPPFTYRNIYLPRVGLVDISDKIPSNAGAVYVTLDVDPISGEGLYGLYWKVLATDNQSYQFDIIQAQIGVEIPLTSTLLTMQDFASGLSSVGNTALNILTGNILGAAGDIASAFSSFSPHPEDIGKHSGFLGYNTTIHYPYINERFNGVADEDNAENGRPLCKVKQISTLSGYFQVLHGDIAIANATRYEMDQINSFLESGMFYE